ncbi:DUF3093 domain-containing protein [Arthrobacter sp. efr-133-TYG-104]|uniref:DUF3093 domain-containing protein n=1 Tax=Arthrobacter sp. efr-133-TYG-104 TaxID=3040324 RepID=UPI00254C3697|nr:DUF3093 domain-containing protein [Arthrobacter sp. efr-133-TYG-104]
MRTSDPSASMPAGNTASSSQPIYTEKLWPSAWIWIVVVGLSSAGLLMFGPISTAAAIIAALVLFALMTTMLLLSTPTISVTQDTLRVGRATIDREFVGTVEGFEKSAASAERGTRLNGLAYMCFRGWVDPVVKIEITDPADRTPYWLTSTRRPDALVSALTSPRA